MLRIRVTVRSCQLDPLNGNVYVFSNRSRTDLKLLHWERGGNTLYYKRLSKGRFHPRIFLRQGVDFRCMRWDELVLLMEGIPPHATNREQQTSSPPLMKATSTTLCLAVQGCPTTKSWHLLLLS